MARIYFLLLGFLICSCNNSASNQNNTKKEIKTDPTTGLLINPIEVPEPETIISREKVGEILDVPPFSLEQNCGMTSENKFDSYCFYKWDSNFQNSGIIVQASRNPIYHEYNDWAIARILTLLDTGESSPGEGTAKFISYDEVGDSGAWSDKASKFYWRHKKDYVFMIAFNSDFSADQKYEIATKIAKEIMKKYT